MYDGDVVAAIQLVNETGGKDLHALLSSCSNSSNLSQRRPVGLCQISSMLRDHTAAVSLSNHNFY